MNLVKIHIGEMSRATINYKTAEFLTKESRDFLPKKRKTTDDVPLSHSLSRGEHITNNNNAPRLPS